MEILLMIAFVVVMVKLPDWIANSRYNNTNNKPNLGKMLEDKYSNNLSATQIKNNIADGKYNRK